MKKDKTRFTIRFNEADPRQLKTMAALEVAGRRKASFIADAVCDYLARYGDGVAAVMLPYTPPPPKVTSHEEAQVPRTELPIQALKLEIDVSGTDSADNDSFDDDMREAVMEGLGAFLS
ncbi:MAG: hypothetical protein FWC16_04325 [Defluviitaleaceae bacterium]|nr:hypothetical protein [Defluviitaleaceae bacterium]MCL2274133.1 hypothetical protein [Defluviitaleaceae bacterium]